jgi:predicted small lipoprotein YifL
MKKIASLLLVTLFVIAIASCGTKTEPTTVDSTKVDTIAKVDTTKVIVDTTKKVVTTVTVTKK